jgi:DNA replication protein DnaC
MTIDQVKSLTHKLRLFGVHNAVESRYAELKANNLDPLEMLHLLLEDETLQRRDALTQRLLTKAKFRFYADVEDWDTSFDRGIPKQKLVELAKGSFWHNKENVIILGKTGEGKTHLAQAIGRRLCQDEIPVNFTSVNLLFEEIQCQRLAGRYLVYIRTLNRSQILILDDFGIRAYTHAEASTLMDILEERYRKIPVIITSQVDPRGWLKLFDDPVIAEAIVDRLINPSQKIILKGGSYREKIGIKPATKITAKSVAAKTKKL